MATYIILSRFEAKVLKNPQEMRDLATMMRERIQEECPGVEWRESYATLGNYDAIDIVEAGSPHEVERAALIIRGYGRAITQTLLATPWRDFMEQF